MKTQRISAGSFDLNKWLFGGYEKDIITMIAGPAGSGKTNFCILAAVSQAKKDNKVLFIDTEGGFSIDRVKQIVSGGSSGSGKGAEVDEAGRELEKILGNILLIKPTNFEEQKKTFLKILDKIKKEHVQLIIVDGMTMLYRLELGDAKLEKSEELTDNIVAKIREINRELAKQMRILAEIARKQNIPIIITNQVYSEFLSEEELRKGVKRGVSLVGGDLLKYWSKCIIELQDERGKKKAILRKHRSLPEKELSFVITNRGIRKKGWI